MLDISEVPAAIRGEVRINRRNMAIRSPSTANQPHLKHLVFVGSMLVFSASILAAWVFALVFSLVLSLNINHESSFLLMAGIMGVMGPFFSALVVAGAASFLANQVKDWVYLRCGAYRLGTLQWTSVAPEACVHLDGEPGGVIWLRVGDTLLRHFPDADDAWTYDQLLWLGEATASRLQRPLVDTRIEADWRSWEADPRHRTRRRLAWRLSRSQEQYPQRHRLQPFEPECLRHTVEGLDFLLPGTGTEREVSIGAHHLEFCGTKWCWSRVDGAVVVFEGEPCTGYLLIARDQRLHTMAQSQDLMVQSQLTWIATAIQTAMERAQHHEAGSAEDVPVPLRQARRQVGG